MSDDKLRDDLNRAHQANDLLQSELLIEAYEQIDAELVGAWRLTAARDTDARERIWHAVQANAKHKNYLQSVANNGKLAQKELDDLIAQNQKITSFR